MANTPSNGAVEWSEAQKQLVRAQLERILKSSPFKHTRRCQSMLLHTVGQVLDGYVDKAKERDVGIAVFGRAPDYDTNQDPVVRMAAVELRRRLAQFYNEATEEPLVRIEFPSGSYMPEFRLPVAAAPVVVAPRVRSRPVAVPAWIFVVAGAVVLAAGLVWWSPWASASALDRFWSPVWSSSDHVLICVGGIADAPATGASAAVRKGSPASSVPSLEELFGRDEGVPLAEVGAIAKIVGQKMARGKAFRVRSHATTKFVDLRDGPVVLIGGFDNNWTVRLLDELHLRFRLERDGPVAWIGDRQNPNQRNWLVDPRSDVARDYAIISRVWNQGTGQEMVSVAGLLPFGTGAAGEFLSEPRYLEAAVAKAGKSWQNKNMQIVIATRLTGANSGPPEVLAIHSW